VGFTAGIGQTVKYPTNLNHDMISPKYRDDSNIFLRSSVRVDRQQFVYRDLVMVAIFQTILLSCIRLLDQASKSGYTCKETSKLNPSYRFYMSTFEVICWYCKYKTT